MKLSKSVFADLIVALPFMALVVVAAVVNLMTYSQLTDWILQASGEQGHADYLRSHILTPTRFTVLRWILNSVTVVSCLLYFFFRGLLSQQFRATLALFRRWGSSSTAELKRIAAYPKPYRIVFALGWLWILGRSFYNAFIGYELQHDEGWTYHHFIPKGVLVSACSPQNNHVLYTLVSAVLNELPLSLRLIIRLPVLLAGLYASWMLYLTASRFINKEVGLIVFLLFACACPSTYYMMYGRGYMLAMAFTITGLYALLSIKQGSSSTGFPAYRVLVVSAILSIYSLPSELMIWVAMTSGFLLSASFRSALNRRKGLLSVALIAGVLVLLYFPAFFMGGAGVVEEGVKAVSHAHNNWWVLAANYAQEVYPFLFGVKYGVWIMAVLSVLLLASVFTKRPHVKDWLWLVLLPVLCPLVVFIFKPVDLPERVWSSLIVFICIGLGILLGTIRRWGLPIALALAVLSASVAQTGIYLNWSKRLDQECRLGIDSISARKPTVVWTNFFYIKPLLEARCDYDHQRIRVWLDEPLSREFRQWDTALHYPVLILDNEKPLPESVDTDYHVISTFSYFTVYERNDSNAPRILLGQK